MKRIYVALSMLVLVGSGLSLTHYTPRTLSSNNSNERKLITEQPWKNQPVEVSEMRVNGKPVALGQAFVSNESDWVRDFSFRVRNATNKRISHARFELQFPLKDTPRRAFFVQPLEYGQTLSLAKPNGSVAPGEYFELSAKVDVGILKQIVREKAVGKYVNMNTAQLSAEIVEFTDNTSWVAGEWLRFDKQTKKWVEMVRVELWKDTNSQTIFQLASMKAPQQQNCYRSAHDIVDCPSDCQCGTRHDIATPGDPVNAGVSQADKIQVCCTKNGIQCVVAYDGVATGCSS